VISKRELQAEFHLSWSTQAIDPRAYSDAIDVVVGPGRAIDLPSRAGEQTVQRVPRQVEIRKIEEVVETDAGFDSHQLVKGVCPSQLKVKGPQPGKIHLP